MVSMPYAEDDNVADDDSVVEQVEAEQDHILVFFSPLALKCIQRKSNETTKDRYTSIGEKYNMCFKMIRSDSRLVKTILFSYGFLQCSSKNPNCNLLWTNTHIGAHMLRSMKSWQRMNHFPRSFMITKKDTLYECIDRSMVQYGDWFNFIPEYFCTPLGASKYDKLKSLLGDVESGLASPFIVKPACSSRGRDIFFLRSVHDLEKLDNGAKLLISRYLDRPFLVNRLKSDLRIYVLVTSFYPLIVYVYSDGLARFAVHEYNDENRRNYDDVNTHLTNYSLNKNSAEFVKNKDISGENIGHKWTLGAFLREMKKHGVDTELLMVRIEDIIIKTLLSVQGSVAASCRKFKLHPNCCFELFGFDILVDEELKPWLLEVNLSPSLACDAPLDSVLKTHLLCDTLNIACVPLVRDRNSDNVCATTPEPTTHEPDEENNVAATETTVCPDSVVVQSSATNGVAATSNGETVKDARPASRNAEQKSADPSVGNGTTRKRKIVNTRASKVRRAKIGCKKMKIFSDLKQSFSAESITPQYISRAMCHFNKLETESLRQGRFIRIFPRSLTWDLYGSVLEDVGHERWDEDLHVRLNDGVELPQVSRRDVEAVHKQLINAKDFKHRDNLSPVVRDLLLKDALLSAEKYAKRMYSGDMKPFPASLPFVRTEARRRTLSEVNAEEVRRAYLLSKRQAQEQRKSKSGALDPTAQQQDGEPPVESKLPEKSSSLIASSTTDLKDLDDLHNAKEYSAGATVVINGQGDLNVEREGTPLDKLHREVRTYACRDEAVYSSVKKLTEVNANFIIRKMRGGAVTEKTVDQN